MNTITLDQFHQVLREAYAVCKTVCVNDTLYFVGYDVDDAPYIANNDHQDYVSLAKVNGDIEVTQNGFFFYINEDPFELILLVPQKNA
jgi:hypothetical protein